MADQHSTGEERLREIVLERLNENGIDNSTAEKVAKQIAGDLTGGNPKCIVIQQAAWRRAEDRIRSLEQQVRDLGATP